ncbi:MAG: DUF885 domain-containing protein [Bdellovibrionales bacterium]
MRILGVLLLALGLSSCLANNSKEEGCGANTFFEKEWKSDLETYPVHASGLNYGERHNSFFQNTPENLKKEHKKNKKTLKKAKKLLSKNSCTLKEKENLKLFIHQAKEGIDGFKFKDRYVTFQSMGGPHTWMPQLYKRVPLKTFQNYKDYLERLSKIPEVFKRAKVLSRLGLKEGITPAKVTFKDYESSFLDVVTENVEESPFYLAFKKFPEDFSEDEVEKLRTEAKDVISLKINPAYKDLHQFWVKEYYPKLRTTIAASDLPSGKEYYNYRVRLYTTLDYTAKEVHEIGKSEVARILKEMEVIKNDVGFKGDLQKFFADLRTNPKFYAKSKDELFKQTTYLLKMMDGKLPKLFGKLPRLPYGVEPIPDYIAHKSPAAYYQHGSAELSKAGVYQINLSNLSSRPLYNLEALSLHEAVPGHHLQIALAQEIEKVPEFRKHMGITAFIEGWGLYAESLGKLVGMYKDPYSDFGRLTYEQWRAMRLVVDTGIHAFGWSRDKAIDYMKSNSGLSIKNITTEVDRYINWPGQALAYKMGELKIKELRVYAKKELGDKYDIRYFHDAVLGSGAVPLKVLEENIKNYVLKIKKSPSE